MIRLVIVTLQTFFLHKCWKFCECAKLQFCAKLIRIIGRAGHIRIKETQLTVLITARAILQLLQVITAVAVGIIITYKDACIASHSGSWEGVPWTFHIGATKSALTAIRAWRLLVLISNEQLGILSMTFSDVCLRSKKQYTTGVDCSLQQTAVSELWQKIWIKNWQKMAPRTVVRKRGPWTFRIGAT